MDIIFGKIKELGHLNGKRDELQYYCKLKIDKVLNVLAKRMLSCDAADLLDCLFNGLPDNCVVSHKNKVKVINVVLQTMRKESASLTHCSDVISRLCLELARMPAEDLVRWCDESVQSIVEDTDVNMIWRDVLPECLNVLSTHMNIRHCGTEMTTAEYKEQCVRTLCQCRWKDRQLIQLAAAFKDMQLNRNDHKQVVNKICSYIQDIPPETLPPLLHQLLKLCKSYNVEIVLAHLSKYFTVRLYSKLEPPPQDSESTTMDIDDIVQHSPAELSGCLSTCIYHITQGAAEPEMIRKHLKAWPKTQLLRAPFLIDLALAISDKGPDFRTACLEVIKTAIEHRIIDELRCKESEWTRSVLPPDVDVATLLKVLTTESANNNQLTVMGLINLAFMLLSVSRIRPTAHACWSHGKLILVRLCKSQPETTAHILTQLADRLAGDTVQRQFADCFHILCKLTPVSVERCPQLVAILQGCRPAASSVPAAVLDAVHPLLNFSTRTRDALIMVCRKGLYSRDSSHRCLALSGLLTVLRHMRLSRSTFSSSQSACSDQYSAHSYLTQLTLDVHATQAGGIVTSRVRNEAMCMEVVSILRRCLVQDAAVKQLLYNKLYDCVKEKTVLHESILEILYEHISKYLPENDDEGAPLLLYKCVQLTATNAVLIEPISHLLYAIAEFVQPVEEEELEDILGSQGAETGSAYLKNKLISIMDQLCTNENLGVVDLEDPGLSDLTPESKGKCLRVQQILQCYEALIAYKILQWTPTSTDVANSVYSLYKKCNQLLEQLKAPSKTSKKGNKSLNETRDTVRTQKSQKSQNRGKKVAPAKLSNMVKDRAGPFKPLPCLWDLKFCLRVVELLYSESLPWSSAEQRDYIRGRRDFHRWALRSVLSTLTADTIEKQAVACHVPKIAAVIYKRCVCRFQEMCDFDDQTTLGCLEVFKTCLTLLFSSNYSLKMDSFLIIITGLSEAITASHIASILERIYTALQSIAAESAEEEPDAAVKKCVVVLIQIASFLLEIPVSHAVEMTNMIITFEDYIRTSKQDWLPLLPALLAAGYRDQQEAQLLDDLLVKTAAVLGRIDEEDTSAGEESTDFPIVDARTGHTVHAHVCSHLTLRFRSVEHLLQRARDLAAAVATACRNQQRIDTELKEVYKCVIVQLCAVSGWTARACGVRCSVRGAGGERGAGGGERALAAAVRLLATLATLARQIDAHTAQHLRFERLLKVCGKKFSTVTDNFITYLEMSQQKQNASKVLRDTKLIPRLVLEAEQFSKNVILLANKGNLNYQQYLSLGTARDFRIKAPVLQEALNAIEEPQPDDNDNEEPIDINDAATEILESDGEQDSGNEESSRRKKKRLS